MLNFVSLICKYQYLHIIDSGFLHEGDEDYVILNNFDEVIEPFCVKRSFVCLKTCP